MRDRERRTVAGVSLSGGGGRRDVRMGEGC